ncbi:hypothetical protein [Lacipirellula parvula]|uniref:Uncharacterized protein n=1 Tax=Lacipirellula parvula TaxID=2650471 RepID=A0A5K7XDX8_9BACT|nr:hypothetical protein [Lacipirellula parvula]BBO33061.1 hypothetical protein PLANPX_2673 [Lacipirellula parvula]
MKPFLSLLTVSLLCGVAVFSFAGEGSAILANPAISAAVQVECVRPEGRRMLSSLGSGTLISGRV